MKVTGHFQSFFFLISPTSKVNQQSVLNLKVRGATIRQKVYRHIL